MFIGLFMSSCVFSMVLSHSEESNVNSDTVKVKYRLNPIVKTATKIDGAQRDLAASVSLIDRRTLNLTSTNAVLEMVQHRIPSLHVTEWGVMGFGVAGQAAGKISIRGMGGGANTHVLILRNGRPDFMGLMGCTIADEFSSDGVERIEIIRGPGSFLYGTNATGGIINIISKRMEKEGFETRITGGYGSFDTKKASLSHGGRIDRFDYYVTASHRQTDGHQPGSDYEARHYTLHMGYRISAQTSMELNANLADMTVQDPGPVSSPQSDHWYDIFRYGGDLTLVRSSRWGETHIKLHANFGRHTFFDGWRSHDRTLGVMVYQNFKPWYGNTTTTGWDYKRYGGDAVDAATDYGVYAVTEYAPYIHTQQLLLTRFIVSAGLRAEHHTLYGYEILPKLGLVLHAAQNTSVRISAAKGFRSPSIRELYFWAPANEALTPERVWNYEIGLTQNFRGLHFEAVVFQSEGSNFIQFIAPPPRWMNSGAFTHKGYELILNALPLSRFEMGVSWSQIYLSEGVFNIPEKKLTAYANYTLGRFTLSGTFLVVRDLTGADFTGSSPQPRLHAMEDYTLLNLLLRARLFPHLEIKVGFKNVLDTEYQTMYGYPMPGRHLIVDISTIL